MQNYKIISHTADIGIEVTGKTKKELFARAAAAVFDLMVSPDNVEEKDQKNISVEGEGPEDLLINFLREVLFLFNGEGWLARSCRIIKLTEKSIAAEMKGEPFTPEKHQIKTEIKAVTYHQFSVKKNSHGDWQARIIFDV
jgi:protein archease